MLCKGLGVKLPPPKSTLSHSTVSLKQVPSGRRMDVWVIAVRFESDIIVA